MANFAALRWEEALPFPVPRRLVLPPRVAVAPARMRPMVDNAGAAFRHHPEPQVGQVPLAPGEASLRVPSTRANCIRLRDLTLWRPFKGGSPVAGAVFSAMD